MPRYYNESHNEKQLNRRKWSSLLDKLERESDWRRDRSDRATARRQANQQAFPRLEKSGLGPCKIEISRSSPTPSGFAVTDRFPPPVFATDSSLLASSSPRAFQFFSLSPPRFCCAALFLAQPLFRLEHNTPGIARHSTATVRNALRPSLAPLRADLLPSGGSESSRGGGRNGRTAAQDEPPRSCEPCKAIPLCSARRMVRSAFSWSPRFDFLLGI